MEVTKGNVNANTPAETSANDTKSVSLSVVESIIDVNVSKFGSPLVPFDRIYAEVTVGKWLTMFSKYLLRSCRASAVRDLKDVQVVEWFQYLIRMRCYQVNDLITPQQALRILVPSSFFPLLTHLAVYSDSTRKLEVKPIVVGGDPVQDLADIDLWNDFASRLISGGLISDFGLPVDIRTASSEIYELVRVREKDRIDGKDLENGIDILAIASSRSIPSNKVLARLFYDIAWDSKEYFGSPRVSYLDLTCVDEVVYKLSRLSVALKL